MGIAPTARITQDEEIHQHRIALLIDLEGPDALTLQRALRAAEGRVIDDSGAIKELPREDIGSGSRTSPRLLASRQVV